LVESFAVGDRLGRYELVKNIGGGGFASVWQARTVGLGGFRRDVAVKVIRPARAQQKRFQDMLLDEARLVARIEHPNVTQIWEVGEDPRSIYVVMELVDGDSLDQLQIRAEELGRKLPLRGVFRVLADVCAGLHVAHELTQEGESLGLVHRDVSPQNILVSRHGIAKLIDFGIAKARERLAGDTTTGYIKGKISFMAPEQARTEDVDRRADVWAVGAVAYELIEGKPPCDAATDVGRLASLVGPARVPPVSDRVPPALAAVVNKALEKDRDARIATALEMKEAIEEALIESELETSPTEVAELFAPFFSGTAGPPAAAATGVEHSIEGAVSSTIDARAHEGTIELPLRKTRWWPVGAAATAIAIAGLSWGLKRDPPAKDADQATSGAAAGVHTGEAPAPPQAATAPEPSVSPAPSAAVSASPEVTATASASVAPSVQRPAGAPRPRTTPRPAPTGPTPAVIDENAIE
jgi:serine/threonine protein kinase